MDMEIATYRDRFASDGHSVKGTLGPVGRAHHTSSTEDEMTTDDGRAEWHRIVARLDELHTEAWAIQTNNHERQTEIWFEVNRLRARIAALAASGVTFDDTAE